MTRYAVRCVLALLLGVAPGYAQQGTTEVRGRVLDPQGALLPGVTVTVRNQDTGMFRETITGVDGTFFVSGIVPGRYELPPSCRDSRDSSARTSCWNSGRPRRSTRRSRSAN